MRRFVISALSLLHLQHFDFQRLEDKAVVEVDSCTADLLCICRHIIGSQTYDSGLLVNSE